MWCWRSSHPATPQPHCATADRRAARSRRIFDNDFNSDCARCNGLHRSNIVVDKLRLEQANPWVDTHRSQLRKHDELRALHFGALRKIDNFRAIADDVATVGLI